MRDSMLHVCEIKEKAKINKKTSTMSETGSACFSLAAFVSYTAVFMQLVGTE